MTEVAGTSTGTSSELCLACGLCCSGAIFDYGPLDAGEGHWLADGRLTPWAGGRGFAFPCPQLDGTRCRIYKIRPAVCGRYRCEVQTGLADGRLSRASAMDLVARAVGLVNEIKAAVPDAGADIGELRRAFQTGTDDWQDAEPVRRLQLARRRLALAALERHLDTHFRRPHQRQLDEQITVAEPERG